MKLKEPIYICYVEFFNLKALSKVKKKFRIQVFSFKEALKDKKNILNRIQVLLIRSRTRVDQILLREMPDLKLVVTMTSGFDHIDFNALKDLDVKVFHTPLSYAESVSELVFLFMFALVRKIFLFRKIEVKRNFWRESFPLGNLLKGKRLGLLGLGNIGSSVSKKAMAFGMKVMAYDPYVPKKKFQFLGVVQKDFKELLKSSDILSLHLPLTQETKSLICQKTLKFFSRKACLINTSRGKIVSEKDVVRALKRNEISGFASDVFEKEPLNPDSPLFSYTQEGFKNSNVLLTPHIGSYTREVLNQVSEEATDILLSWMENKKLFKPLPESLLWWKKLKKKEPYK